MNIISSGISVKWKEGFKSHSHPWHEIVAVLDGSYSISSEYKQLTLLQHQTVFIPADMIHKINPSGYWKTLHILFKTSDQMLPSNMMVFEGMHQTSLVTLMTQINTFYNDSTIPLTIADHLLTATLELLNTALESYDRKDRIPPALSQAIRHLEDHLEQPYYAPDFARQTGLSIPHLNKLFRDFIGYSPLQYQTKLRLDKATRLMLNPYLNIAEISQLCGWNDVNYFIRLFRKKHHISPGKYIKYKLTPGEHHSARTDQDTHSNQNS